MKRQVAGTVLVILAGIFCFLLAEAGAEGETDGRSYILAHGPAETGAVNLVTAIYLGYRAFDTLLETIVLVVAVLGVNLLFVKSR